MRCGGLSSGGYSKGILAVDFSISSMTKLFSRLLLYRFGIKNDTRGTRIPVGSEVVPVDLVIYT